MNHDDAKKLLLDIKAACDAIRLPFFLNYGTLLGAIRDGGFIEGDKDIDIGFLAEDFVPKATPLGCELSLRDVHWYPLIQPFTKCWAIKTQGDPHADLVAYALHDGRRFNPSTMADFCHVHPEQVLSKFRQLRLFGEMFQVPDATGWYLEQLYGPNWRTPAPDTAHRCRVDGYQFPKDLLEGL